MPLHTAFHRCQPNFNRRTTAPRGIADRRFSSATAGLLLLAAVIAGGCQKPTTRTPLVATREPWTFAKNPGTQITTPHYHIWTTCQDKMLLDVIPHVLEGAYQEFVRLLPSDVPAEVPMPTYLFERRWEWEAYTRKFAGPHAATYLRIRSGGYEENGVTVSHYGSRRSTLSVIAHESLHQYLTRTDRPNVPAWINEGLACQFEAFTLGEDGWPKFNARENFNRRRNLRKALQADRLIPLQQLLSSNAGEAINSGSEQTDSYYAQVWALVLYLLESPDVPADGEGFKRLLSDLDQGEMRRLASQYQSAQFATDDIHMTLDEAIFRLYITHDLAEFEARYRAFARKLTGLDS